jgi:dethiobiotin synthetase
MADLVWALAVPTVMVVGVRLGCLNHAQLTRLAIEARGVSFAGWIASGVDPAMARTAENLASLERLLGEPALAVAACEPEAAASLTLEAAAARLAQRAISF